MSHYIRTCSRTPRTGDFASGEGTPVVIDFTDDTAWFLKKNVPTAVRPLNLTTELNHAGITIPAPRASTLGATWLRIINYTNAAGSYSVGFTPDLAAGTLTATVSENVLFTMNVIMSFTELNAGRTTYIRPYNVTDGIAGIAVPIPIGRNTGGVAIGQTVLAFANAGKAIALEVGGGDAFTNVTLDFAQFGAVGMIGTDTNNLVVIV